MRLAIGFDPGESTGWVVGDLDARSDRDVVVDSGQCDYADSMAHVFEVVGTKAPAGIAIEYPVIVPTRGGFGNAGSALSTAWKAGCLFGRCITLWPSALMWQPRPAEHRAITGLGRGGNKRALIAQRTCLWVRATTGIDCGDGLKETSEEWDRASAIALLFAFRGYLAERRVA